LTLLDHFAEQFRNGDERRFERLCNIIVDGRRLGTYELDVARTKADWKRFVEIQWAGFALVGCDADLKIAELRTQPERRNATTPDFEATLKAGGSAQIELVRLILEDEVPQFKYYDDMGRETQAYLSQGPYANAGEFIFRSQDGIHAISKADVAAIAGELAAYILTTPELQHVSTYVVGPRLYGHVDEFPLLAQLNVAAVHRTTGAPVRVLWAPLPADFDDDEIVKDFVDGSLRKKMDNFAKGYNTAGTAVQLLVAIPPSPIQTLRAASLIYTLRAYPSLDVGPFERVMFGAYTCGVAFVGNQPPIFTGITRDV
jgi:hypothetical protein